MKYAKMLDGRYALILGGDTAVGGAVARAFAAHGAHVAVAGAAASRKDADCRSQAPAPREVFAVLQSDIPDAIAYESPMDSSLMDELCASVLKDFPYVDILVGATDFYKTGDTHAFPAHELRHMLDANLCCAAKCFQRLLPGMLEHRRGEMILFAPDLADAGLPRAAAAAACAGAICAFAQNVTNDYIRYRVRANVVMYPFVGAPGRSPLSGEPDPLDAANAALWYACDMSRFVTGEKLSVNGGLEYIKSQGGENRVSRPGAL